VEGEALTPKLLARRFTLNPVLINLVTGVLVLDVGHAWCDPCRSDAGHPEDRL
jgi:hypothetical protein